MRRVVTVWNCAALHQTPFSLQAISYSPSILKPLELFYPEENMTSPNYGSLSFWNISTLLSVSLTPPPPTLFLFRLTSPPFISLSRAECCSDIIEGIWCKIRARAKRVLDYLVMLPPHPGFKLNFRTATWTWAKLLLREKYVINTPQLSHHSERLGVILFVPTKLKMYYMLDGTYLLWTATYIDILSPCGSTR